MEARCKPLEAQALAAEVERVLIWFEQRAAVVDVMFGWSYEHVDSQWKWQTIPSAHLRSLLQVSGRDGAFIPGDGDVFLKSPAGDVEFTLCHESDIHVVSGSADVVRPFIDSWSSRDIAYSTRSSAQGPWIAAG